MCFLNRQENIICMAVMARLSSPCAGQGTLAIRGPLRIKQQECQVKSGALCYFGVAVGREWGFVSARAGVAFLKPLACFFSFPFSMRVHAKP